MSYITLCKWLETGEVTGTVSQVTAGRLNSYSTVFDQLTAVDGHKPALIRTGAAKGVTPMEGYSIRLKRRKHMSAPKSSTLSG
jgi:hypothetical protein